MIAIDNDGYPKSVGMTSSGFRAKKIILSKEDASFMLKLVREGSKEDIEKWFVQLEARFL